MPTLKLRRALEEAPVGARLSLLADDPLARVDVPHFAAMLGITIESLSVDDGVLCVVMVKP